MYHLLDKPRVLVIDDEPSICQVLRRTLELDGYEVVTCCTGEEAEARFQTEWFDLAVIDLRLKESRGDRLFYYGIACQPHLERQTIFLTGDITPGGSRLIQATGCPMMLKPYNASELLNLLFSLYPRVRGASA
jgi:DNA-binding response OmpR family regulator